MGIRIVAEGSSSASAKIIDTDTGNVLKNVVKLDIELRPGKRNLAYMTVLVDSMEIEADVEPRPYHCKSCGHMPDPMRFGWCYMFKEKPEGNCTRYYER